MYSPSVLCEPKLDKCDLYSKVSIKGGGINCRKILNILSYIDCKMDLVEVSTRAKIKFDEVVEMALILELYGVIFKEDL